MYSTKKRSDPTPPPSLPPVASTSTSNTRSSKRSRSTLEASSSKPKEEVGQGEDDEDDEEDPEPKKKKGKKSKKVEKAPEQEEELKPTASSSRTLSLPAVSAIEVIDVSTPTKKDKKSKKAKKAEAKLEKEKVDAKEEVEMSSKVDAEDEAGKTTEWEDVDVHSNATTSALEGLSAAERKLKKGKGKAIEVNTEVTSSAKKMKNKKTLLVDAEASRLEKELAFKDSMIATQAALLNSLRSTMACTVCLETLDIPYSLRCGHVFCRKCLVNWFHRVIVVEVNEGIDSDSDSSSDDESDIILSDAAPPRRSNSSVGENMGDMDTEDDSSSSSDSDSSSGGPGVLRGSIGGRAFNVVPGRGQTQNQVYRTMEDGLFAAAAGLLRPNPTASTNGRRVTVESPEPEEPSIESMRLARVARFAGGSASTATFTLPRMNEPSTSTSRVPPRIPTATSNSRPTPRAATVVELSDSPPPVASTSVHRHHLDPVPLIPFNERANQVNLLAPFGIEQKVNLLCPQCRDVVDRTPTRIFALTEVVTLVRTAEKEGVFDVGRASPSSEKAKSEAGGETKGMDENDTTWGGLFKAAGEKETSKEKRAREAHVVRDVDDRVARCFDCNWEVNPDTGECEGCGKNWDLTSDDEDALSDSEPAFGRVLGGFGLPELHRRELRDEERSEDDDEPDEDDEAFLDDEDTHRIRDYHSDDSEESAANTSDAKPVMKRRGRLVIDSSEEEESSSSDDEVIVAGPSTIKKDDKKKLNASKDKKAVVVVSDEDEEAEEDGNDSSIMIKAVEEESDSSEEDGAKVTSSHFARKGKKDGKGKKDVKIPVDSSDDSSEEENKRVEMPKFKKRVINVDEDDD